MYCTVFSILVYWYTYIFVSVYIYMYLYLLRRTDTIRSFMVKYSRQVTQQSKTLMKQSHAAVGSQRETVHVAITLSITYVYTTEILACIRKMLACGSNHVHNVALVEKLSEYLRPIRIGTLANTIEDRIEQSQNIQS